MYPGSKSNQDLASKLSMKAKILQEVSNILDKGVSLALDRTRWVSSCYDEDAQAISHFLSHLADATK